MVILKHLQVKSQTSSYLGQPPTRKETFSTKHIKNLSTFTFYHKQNLPHSEFYHNSCLLTSPSPKLKKLESNLFLHNFYLATCDTLSHLVR